MFWRGTGDNRLDPALSLSLRPEAAVEDWKQETLGLAGPGACGDDGA